MNTLIRSFVIFSILVTLAALPAWAGQVAIPHTFTAGDPAVAAEVNANFSAVETEVNDNATALGGMPGVTSSPGGYSTLDGTASVIESITVNAPTSGYLIVSASGNQRMSSGSYIVLQLENATTSTISTSFIHDQAFNDWKYYSLSYVFTVGSGNNEINFLGYVSGGAGDINVRSFYAIFVPTTY